MLCLELPDGWICTECNMKGIVFHGLPLPMFKREWSLHGVKDRKKRKEFIEKRTHLMATILAAFPTTSTKKLAKELGISADIIRELAKMFGLRKADNYRSEAYKNNDNAPRHEILKISPDGKVVKEYRSMKDAAADNKCDPITIKTKCINGALFNGYYYRFKKHEKNKNKD